MADFFKEIFGNYQWELIQLARIIFAGICGFAIGFERMKRDKEAGIRTHFVLSIGVATITSVSLSFENSDASRIAAQIVSGIGFLGAGMIFFRGEYLHGLTTAAGIWATVGVGMSAANGLYILALVVTIVIVVAQSILHGRTKLFGHDRYKILKIKFVYTDELANYITNAFQIKQFSKFRAIFVDGKLVADALVRTTSDCDSSVLTKIMREKSEIESIERLDAK